MWYNNCITSLNNLASMRAIRNNFTKIAGYIFLFVGLSHGLRAIMNWNLTVDAWQIPVWVSYAASAILLFLSYIALTKKK